MSNIARLAPTEAEWFKETSKVEFGISLTWGQDHDPGYMEQ